jgi:cell division transport system permease protein
MRALGYFFDEALASLYRGYKTALTAVATIGVALFILGAFLVVTSNMERLFTRWQDAAEFSVYLRDGATPAERAAVENQLRGSRLIRALETVSKEEALKRFRQNFGELAAAANDLPENPLPASIEVRMSETADPADVELLAEQTSKLGGVADVRYDRRWIQRLVSAVRVVRAGGFVLAAILIFAASLTVASVVRLALVARREEIHIMQLVGAPMAYIRGPFVMEGFLQGGTGAALALVALWGMFTWLRDRPLTSLAGAIDPASLRFLSIPTCGALLIGGMAVGCIGGFIAARNTREVAD